MYAAAGRSPRTSRNVEAFLASRLTDEEIAEVARPARVDRTSVPDVRQA